MTDGKLKARLQLHHGATGRVGAERIRLLEAIAEHHSITAAAKTVGMSFRAAWDAVQALNALFARPLVETQVGGREGGLATVTPAGHALILAFQRIDRELAHVAGQLEHHLADETEPLDRLVWRLGIKTSARNQLIGAVESLTLGAVNTEVVLKIGDGDLRIVAIITSRSAGDLGLAVGVKAMALVKSSFVIIAEGHDPIRTSARNQLLGTVVEHRSGAVSDEVVLEVDGGARLTATITRESGEKLQFAAGTPVQALIKASHVILAVE
jgi:molybdate transport system regulatory protein